jgi:arabinogalactan endo-1,4-beta-galactosidase
MEACGAKFLDHGKPADPFVLLKQHGGNLMRVRLWNNPTGRTTAPMTMCSRRSPAPMPPGSTCCSISIIPTIGPMATSSPARRLGRMDTDAQVKALHDYTRERARQAGRRRAVAEMVQVGNETNAACRAAPRTSRSTGCAMQRLLNAGISAVREAIKAHGKPIRSCCTSPSPKT